MRPETWFAELTRVHETVSRVRWRFRCRADASSSAAKDISLAASNLAGVLHARVNEGAQSLVVDFDPSLTSADRLQAGLAALEAPQVVRGGGSAANALSLRSVFSSLATLVTVESLPESFKTPVTTVAAAPVLVHALGDLRNNGLTSHVLEALAVSISIARKDFVAANTTNFMLALGEYLEESIARRSEDLLKYLVHPVSQEVWVERNGQEILTPSHALSVGDIVIAATGTVIPIDGTILDGVATINEASMTGESTPVAKCRGDSVLSGTLIEEGRVRVYAEHVGNMTAVARIADYVEQSLAVKSDAQIQASLLADRLVPIVLGLAGAAFVVTGDWERTASVLQADFSCALKLATPVAFKSAMYSAGKEAILFKGATAVERLAAADTFVFDKTGTLTTGVLEVTDSVTLDSSFTADDLICLAASVEEHYFHPLAMAVVNAAKNAKGEHFDHAEVEFVVAHGVASQIDGKRIVIGSRHFVEEDEGIDISVSGKVIDRLYRQGKTLLYIGYGGVLIGLIALKDSVRDNAVDTIRRLRSLGAKRILMLTGDHRRRAAEMASHLGLDGFHAELLPADKVQILESLEAEGARVAFIGDGINDAAALSGSSVGIAMQKGADIARMSADIALLEDDLARVADAKEIAACTMKLIDQNYRVAVGLNTAILGAAATGLLRPVAAAMLHNGTTIAILLRALLKNKTPGR